MTAGVALVTGATGFVGSHVVRRLLLEGSDVHVLRRAQSDFRRLTDVSARLRVHEVDLMDAPGLAALMRRVRPDRIFHLAAATVVAGVEACAADLITVNVQGTVNLLNAGDAIDYAGLVTTGDSFEYAPAPTPLRESDPCRPESLHGVTKLAATLAAQAHARSRGRPIVTLRLFSAYGPADHPRRLVPRVIRAAVSGDAVGLSRREIARDWVYVGDVADLYLEAARRAGSVGGGVFNAGSGAATTIGEIVDALIDLAGSSLRPQWGTFDAPPHDRTPWIADMRRTFETFAWRPRTPLREGLARTVAAMRAALP